MNMGWFSIFIVIGLIIWIGIGQGMKEDTCSKCKKLNSLYKIDDTIIEKKESWKGLTKIENGKQIIKNVPIVIETHKMTYKCKNCGNIEIKYKETEYENTRYSHRI